MRDKNKLKLNFALLIAGVLAGVVLLNLVVSTIAEKVPLKWDLTKNKMFELSEETINILKNIDREIDIYYFVTTGRENLYIEQTVDMYRGYSDKVSFQQKDPAVDPVFAKSIGAEVTENSIIVKAGDRTRVIDSSTMTDDTYQQYNIVEFKLERQLTRAIDYVLRENDINVLFTKGHEEIGYNFLKAPFEDENVTVSEIDLKSADIPGDTAAIYIAGPTRDFSADEVLKLQKYLEGGGSLNVSLDYGAGDIPLLRQYLTEYWGVSFGDDIILETNDTMILMSNPFYLMPTILPHDITASIADRNVSVIWPNARSIFIADKPGVVSVPLLSTSPNAVSKNAAESVSYTVEEGDIEGQYTLASVLEYINTAQRTRTRIFVSGTSLYSATMFLEEASVANVDFVRDALVYLIGETGAGISVAPKNVAVSYMILSESDKNMYNFVYGYLPPILIFAAGIVMWFRRRHL